MVLWKCNYTNKPKRTYKNKPRGPPEQLVSKYYPRNRNKQCLENCDATQLIFLSSESACGLWVPTVMWPAVGPKRDGGQDSMSSHVTRDWWHSEAFDLNFKTKSTISSNIHVNTAAMHLCVWPPRPRMLKQRAKLVNNCVQTLKYHEICFV